MIFNNNNNNNDLYTIYVLLQLFLSYLRNIACLYPIFCRSHLTTVGSPLSNFLPIHSRKQRDIGFERWGTKMLLCTPMRDVHVPRNCALTHCRGVTIRLMSLRVLAGDFLCKSERNRIINITAKDRKCFFLLILNYSTCCTTFAVKSLCILQRVMS